MTAGRPQQPYIQSETPLSHSELVLPQEHSPLHVLVCMHIARLGIVADRLKFFE